MPSHLYEIDAHATTLPWLESPFTSALLANAGHLSDADRTLAKKYAEDGYVVVDLNLSAETCAALTGGLAPVFNRDAPDLVTRAGRIQDAWRLGEVTGPKEVLDIALAPKILDALRMLYRREPVPFQTLNFPVGTQQATHSDTIHFHSTPARYMCGVWVALEDIHPSAGPLHYYPGSHKLPIYTLDDIGIAGSLGHGAGVADRLGYGYRDYERFIASMAEHSGLPRAELTVKRGQALIWSANLLHGGSPVLDHARSRHSQVTHYFFAECAYYTPMCSDLALGRIATREVLDLSTREKAQAAYCGLPLNTTANTTPRVGTPRPGRTRFATQAIHRVLCWPRYDAPAALAALARQVGPALLGRSDACLCLRHDAEHDPPLADAMAAVDRAFCEVLGDAPPLQVLIVDDAVPRRAWGELGAQATCMLRLGDEEGVRAAFVHAVPRPVYTPEALRAALGPTAPTAAAAAS